MSRRRRAERRDVAPDPKYGDWVLTKFVNTLMYDGKKSTAQRALYGALDLVEHRAKEDPIEIFRRAVDNVKPMVEVKSRRVGGSTYQVPIEVRPERRQALAIRWLIQYARARGEKSMRDKLAGEILDAANLRGGAVKKRE
ncbi:MAG: 30S ribosomal protein S7, partial [Candidatus Methylomirabilis sp.]|nr:30S ribosomal protein S7 [Deltaproteobacteria bacterium]